MNDTPSTTDVQPAPETPTTGERTGAMEKPPVGPVTYEESQTQMQERLSHDRRKKTRKEYDDEILAAQREQARIYDEVEKRGRGNTSLLVTDEPEKKSVLTDDRKPGVRDIIRRSNQGTPADIGPDRRNADPRLEHGPGSDNVFRNSERGEQVMREKLYNPKPREDGNVDFRDQVEDSSDAPARGIPRPQPLHQPSPPTPPAPADLGGDTIAHGTEPSGENRPAQDPATRALTPEEQEAKQLRDEAEARRVEEQADVRSTDQAAQDKARADQAAATGTTAPAPAFPRPTGGNGNGNTSGAGNTTGGTAPAPR